MRSVHKAKHDAKLKEVEHRYEALKIKIELAEKEHAVKRLQETIDKLVTQNSSLKDILAEKVIETRSI